MEDKKLNILIINAGSSSIKIALFETQEPVQDFINNYASSNQLLLTWIFSLAFGLYVYNKYHFLTKIAPSIALPYYRRGIVVTSNLLNLSNSFKAKKSHEALNFI